MPRTAARTRCLLPLLGALIACAGACTEVGTSAVRGDGTGAATPAPSAPAANASSTATSEQGAGRLAVAVREGELDGLRYLEQVRGARFEDRLPMVVMLHGRGDRPRPEIVGDMEAPVRVVLPQAFMPWGNGGFSWFDYDRAAPPEQLALGIARACDRLASAIGKLQKQLPTRGRVVVTGFSQGGMLSYALALRSPALFERAVPLAGLLPASLWPERPEPGVRYPPIRACHGTADTLVPFEPARALVTALAERGFDAELTEFPGVHHSVSPAMLRRQYEELRLAVAALSTQP